MKKKISMPVPFVQQINNKTGLAACAEMVLKYFGVQINQREIYDKAKWGEGEKEGCTDAGIGMALSDLGYKFVCWKNERPDAPKEWKDLEQYYWPQYWRAVKLGVVEIKKDADMFLIKEFIDKGVPVFAEVDNGKFSGKQTTWTQFILVIGYSNTHFTYHSPLDRAGCKKMAFQKFAECWAETPFVNKSIRTIVKKGENV